MTMPARPQPQQQRRGVQYALSERTAARSGVGSNSAGVPGSGQGVERSLSRKEQVKRYLKRETASFFGVDEATEEEQQVGILREFIVFVVLVLI